MIVAVVTDFNFGALGIGVESMEKRGATTRFFKGAFDAYIQHDIAITITITM